MKLSKHSTLAKISMTAALALFAAPVQSIAQTPAPVGATVHGHISNAAGLPFGTGEIKFTTERSTPTAELKFKPNLVFPIDAKGDYTATGIPVGEYYVFVTQGAIIADRVDLSVKAADTNITLNDDMSRPEYIATMTDEQKKQLADFKAKNAAATSANAIIAKLNTTLKTVNDDLAKAAPTKGDVSADVTMMKEATGAKPDEPLLWSNYGNTLLAQGDHLTAADKAAGKPAATDPDVQQAYTDAVDAYKKAIALDAASKKPDPAKEAANYNQMGNALSHAGKNEEAAAAFESAVKASPAQAGLYYRNEAVVFYTAGQFDQAVAAADKTIAADPKNALAYYIKGQSLATKTTTDKAGKMVPPPGCVDAYQEFLQLANPDDPKVNDAKQMLAAFGEKIQTKFKAGK